MSLFSAFRACAISEWFLFEQLQVYHSRDLSFIIFEERFVICFLGCWDEGGRKEEKNNLHGSKVLSEITQPYPIIFLLKELMSNPEIFNRTAVLSPENRFRKNDNSAPLQNYYWT